jgi:membrane associated rhomboid family serine protease
MFFLIPWRVDVPQERWPVMNWLILLALVAVFAVQVRDRARYKDQQEARPYRMAPAASKGNTPATQPHEPHLPSPSEVPDITHDWELRSGNPKGLFGYMWLHGDVLHLLGNLLFLWIFGNALCAKIGNLKYLGLYVLFGIVAGIAQLLRDSSHPVLGASGAINGVVGAYLVLFFENEITCLFAFWFIALYVRWFAVSSVWMILFWLSWDVLGALWSHSNVGHSAHLGGFAAGFGIALLLCKNGWITMEKYERSLLQMWEERTRGRKKEPLDVAYARLGLRMTDEERQQDAPTYVTAPEPEPMPLPPVESGHAPDHRGSDAFIRTACACGHAIRVTRQYAGRTVRCPRCKQPVVIPDKTDFFGPAPPQPAPVAGTLKKAESDFIGLVCRCGKRIRVPAQYGGRTAKCPHCGIRLKIPTVPR